MSHPWAFIGGGTMAQAIAAGALAAGVLHAGQIGVAEPDPTRHPQLRALTPNVVSSAAPLLDWLRRHEPSPGDARIVLAVKPQMLGDVSAELRPILERDGVRRVIVSILAGTTTESLQRHLGEHAAVIRVMPNTPARVRAGATAYCLGSSAREDDARTMVELFGAVGPLVERIDEPLMDAFTAVGGSGPAYVFYLAEAMTRAAVECGFDPAAAGRIVRQTIAGAAQLLRDQPETTPELLRAGVTSKGGTTAAAVRVLDDARVQQTIVRAITAARDKCRELSR